MKTSFKSVMVIALLAGPIKAVAEPGVLSCKYLPPIQEGFLNQHIKYKKASSEMEAKVVDQMIKRLDPLKIYLLKKDEDKIKKMLTGVFKNIQKGKCDQVFKANEFITQKVSERVEFVRGFLDDKYKFDKKVKILLDSDKRKRFASTKEVNEFHKKYIHFQISNYLLSDTKLDEAKVNVVKNYERILKSLKKESKEELLAEYLDAYARALDPHSSFFSADALETFRIQMSLSLEGIGATLSSKDGFTVVESLVPGGAADKSGQLQPKDKIVAVRQDGDKKAENVIEMELNDVVKKIRGKKGTKVHLSVLRKEKGESKRLEIQIVRDKVSLEDEAAQISYHKIPVGKDSKKTIGLINLPSFYADVKRNGRSAAKDVKKLIKEANAKKVDALVLDLSGNGGGSLEDAVKITGLFIKTGNVVKQSFPDPERPAMALADVDPSVDYDGPLVVLTSRASASASEIVSGALQDYGRAVIVGGDHTFGKGTVQTVRDLPRGLGALKITVGMFFTAGGYSTQHRGVSSDIVFPSALSTEDIGEKTYDHSLPPSKVTSFVSSDAFVHTGPNKWQILDKKTITKLSEASKKRISESDKFKEIQDEIKKSEQRGKVLDLAEIMDEEKKNKKEEDGKVLGRKEKLKKYYKRADVEEALNIAADLSLLQEKKSLTLGAAELNRAASSMSDSN